MLNFFSHLNCHGVKEKSMGPSINVFQHIFIHINNYSLFFMDRTLFHDKDFSFVSFTFALSNAHIVTPDFFIFAF